MVSDLTHILSQSWYRCKVPEVSNCSIVALSHAIKNHPFGATFKGGAVFALKMSETASPWLMEPFWLQGWSRFGLHKVRNGATGGTTMVPLGKRELKQCHLQEGARGGTKIVPP